MALSNPRAVYGIHNASPYSRTTGLPYGTAKVLANSSMAISGELVELFGGSQKFAWAVEESTVTADITLAPRQIEDWMFELFLGKAPTTDSSGTSGSVGTIANKKGSSMVSATGLASAEAKSGSEADLKFGRYVVKAVSATTVDVYALSDVDFKRGTDKDFEDDLLKITSSALTVTADTAVEVPGFGVTLTGGSGTIGMTVGDTAEFEVYPVYEKRMNVKIGGSSDTFPEFGMLMMAQQRGNGEMFEIDAFRCKGSGLPLGLTEKAFAEPEINVKAFYDAEKNAVAEIRWVQPT